MSRDIFDDRHRFTDACRAFVTKQKSTTTPSRLAAHRPLTPAVHEYHRDARFVS